MKAPWLRGFVLIGVDVKATNPAYFFGLGSDVHAVMYVRIELPIEVRSEILANASSCLNAFISAERHLELLPRTVKQGDLLLRELQRFAFSPYWQPTADDFQLLHNNVLAFEVVLGEELGRMLNFVLTDKGGLSVSGLMEGYSAHYPTYVLELIDSFIRSEIDETSKCLACDRNTACGFHILRSVEVAIKGYIHAVKGKLPNPTQRNWGEYIAELQRIAAPSDLIDELRVLKTKRNPLMHPQETLNSDQARQLLCLCEATICAVIEAVRDKKLDAAFKASLAVLPNI